MQKLDRSRDFGVITPAYIDTDTMDRPAVTSQDGKLFDVYDNEIVSGVPGPAVVDPPTNKDNPSPRRLPVSELIANAHTMPWAEFKRQAKAILGNTCPASKEQIITTLSKAQAEYDERKSRRIGPPLGDLSNTLEAGEEQSSAPPPVQQIGTIDLSAWGRGQKQYLFADVRKAIRTRFSRSVTTVRDAIDALIDEEIVQANVARKA
jgi:hypothetical protein